MFSELCKESNDYANPLYNTKYGIYTPNCGLKNVLMSFGHDGTVSQSESTFIILLFYAEYLFRVLTSNSCRLPEQGLYMIRYHSFYPWHTHGAYQHLCDDKDKEMLPWVQRFK